MVLPMLLLIAFLGESESSSLKPPNVFLVRIRRLCLLVGLLDLVFGGVVELVVVVDFPGVISIVCFNCSLLSWFEGLQTDDTRPVPSE